MEQCTRGNHARGIPRQILATRRTARLCVVNLLSDADARGDDARTDKRTRPANTNGAKTTERDALNKRGGKEMFCFVGSKPVVAFGMFIAEVQREQEKEATHQATLRFPGPRPIPSRSSSRPMRAIALSSKCG